MITTRKCSNELPTKLNYDEASPSDQIPRNTDDQEEDEKELVKRGGKDRDIIAVLLPREKQGQSEVESQPYTKE
ncbi:hypothetical protein V5O48_016678, partial [Marasmius crinis-equi]